MLKYIILVAMTMTAYLVGYNSGQNDGYAVAVSFDYRCQHSTQ